MTILSLSRNRPLSGVAANETHLHVAAQFDRVEVLTWMLATNPLLDVQDYA